MKQILFNKAIRILLITNGLILISAAMFGPIYAIFVEQIGGNLLDASLTGGIFAIAAGLTSLFSGNLADKTKHSKKIVAFGYLMMALGFFLYTKVNSIHTLFAIQVLIGFGEAIYSPAFDKLYSEHLAKTKAGRQWGTWESMNYFTLAVGAIIGGIIASQFGFNTLFLIMSSISAISAAYILIFAKEI